MSQLIVAVNKMDTVHWQESRYDEVVRKLGQFMKQAGFKEADTSFIPVSGLSGENLAKPISEPKLSEWYKGSTLVEQIGKSAYLRETDILSRETTLSELFLLLVCKRVYSKRKEYAPLGNKFFPFIVDPFLEGVLCEGKQTGSYKSCLPCKR